MQEDNRKCRGGHARRAEEDGDLGTLLDNCGHFYAHHIGGVRGQGSALAWIGRNPGITQRELGALLGVHPASVSELLMKLERKGLVEKEKDEDDRRMVRVRLTEAGEQALQAAKPEMADPFQALTGEEQETLKQLLRKLLTDWEARSPVEQHHGHGRHGHHRGHHGAGEGRRPQEALSAQEESEGGNP